LEADTTTEMEDEYESGWSNQEDEEDKEDSDVSWGDFVIIGQICKLDGLV